MAGEMMSSSSHSPGSTIASPSPSEQATFYGSISVPSAGRRDFSQFVKYLLEGSGVDETTVDFAAIKEELDKLEHSEPIFGDSPNSNHQPILADEIVTFVHQHRSPSSFDGNLNAESEIPIKPTIDGISHKSHHAAMISQALDYSGVYGDKNIQMGDTPPPAPIVSPPSLANVMSESLRVKMRQVSAALTSVDMVPLPEVLRTAQESFSYEHVNALLEIILTLTSKMSSRENGGGGKGTVVDASADAVASAILSPIHEELQESLQQQKQLSRALSKLSQDYAKIKRENSRLVQLSQERRHLPVNQQQTQTSIPASLHSQTGIHHSAHTQTSAVSSQNRNENSKLRASQIDHTTFPPPPPLHSLSKSTAAPAVQAKSTRDLIRQDKSRYHHKNGGPSTHEVIQDVCDKLNIQNIFQAPHALLCLSQSIQLIPQFQKFVAEVSRMLLPSTQSFSGLPSPLTSILQALKEFLHSIDTLLDVDMTSGHETVTTLLGALKQLRRPDASPLLRRHHHNHSAIGSTKTVTDDGVGARRMP